MANTNLESESLGRSELELLRYVSEQQSVSVGDVAAHFAASRGIARTTVQTMMQRLVKKGFLKRKQVNAVYQYSPSVPAARVVSRLIADFIQGVLGGSISPFVAHLNQTSNLSDKEVEELKTLVTRLEASSTDKTSRSRQKGV